jgi:two-component system response regulator DesR
VALVSSRDISDRRGRRAPSRTGTDAPEDAGPALTDRERRIVKLLAEGMTNRMIAEAVSLSPNTVKDHVRSVLRKLNARNRAQAVLAATKRGLL